MVWGPLEIGLLAVALAMDAFSVGVVVGLDHTAPRQIFRLSFHFGLFQALMPLLGALPSGLAATYVAAVAPYIVFVLLAAIGGHMILDAWRGDEARERPTTDLTRGLSLLGLSVATSIDAFGAGVSLGLGQAPLLAAVAAIGLTALVLTVVAMLLGRRLHALVGRRSGYVGGVMLIALGVRMLL